MPGPTRSSAALRELAGTNRPDRDPVDTPSPGQIITLMPPSPVWMLDRWALDEWRRLGPILLRAGLLTQGNIHAFAQLCATHGALASTYERGGVPVASSVSQYIKLVGEFGLTPASARRVTAPDPAGNKGNRFGGNGKR